MARYKDKIKTVEMELALASWVGFTRNLVVPNVTWGLGFQHELDICVITASGYIWETEIKVSLSDLKKDKEKFHGHRSHKIKRLYFAVPSYLEHHVAEHAPERAGIIIVRRNSAGRLFCHEVRKPTTNNTALKVSDKERYKLARLGAIRLWTLKRKLQKTGKQMTLFN